MIIRARVWLPKYKQMEYDLFSIRSDGRANFNVESIVMLSLNRKDKTGKEIFCGDILATSNDGKDGCDVWSEKENGYTAIFWDDKNLCFSGTNWFIEDDDQSVFELKYCRVVGNIYENPKIKIVDEEA